MSSRQDFEAKRISELLVNLIREFVDVPEKVECVVHESKHSTIFEMNADESDYGKVIGRQGQMADALRSLVRAMAGCYDRRLILEFSFGKKKEGSKL